MEDRPKTNDPQDHIIGTTDIQNHRFNKIQ